MFERPDGTRHGERLTRRDTLAERFTLANLLALGAPVTARHEFLKGLSINQTVPTAHDATRRT